jgi:soluble lytic murein transglycosylase-like protein
MAARHVRAGLTIALRRRLSVAWLALAAAAAPTFAHADCFDDAAEYHHVNPWILRAIAARESGFKPDTMSRNTNGTVDIGMFGTNSVHLPELARYGINQADLLDSCKSAYVAAWRLAKMVKKYGNTWQAVGSYHSETPVHRVRYETLIRQIIDFWTAQGLMRPQ